MARDVARFRGAQFRVLRDPREEQVSVHVHWAARDLHVRHRVSVCVEMPAEALRGYEVCGVLFEDERG